MMGSFPRIIIPQDDGNDKHPSEMDFADGKSDDDVGCDAI